MMKAALHAPAAEVRDAQTYRRLLAQDVRHACRMLRRQPGYSALAVLTMALGVGATTALFSLAYGVLYRPLPWPDAGRIVRLYETRQGATKRFDAIMTNAAYMAWRDHPATIDGLAAWRVDPVLMDTGGGADPHPRGGRDCQPLPAARRAARSRRGLHGDGRAWRGWRAHCAVARAVAGAFRRTPGRSWSESSRRRQAVRVVAVMPRAFAFPDGDTRAWRPMTVRFTKGGLSMFSAIARLKPGVTPAQAAAEGTARARGGPDPGPVVMAVFGSRAPAQITAVPLLEAQTAGVRPAILTFLAAVALLLVAAVGNVAGLQLARGAARRREMAIRAALGAGGWRLIRQALAENLVIGLAGGVGGLCLAAALGRSAAVAAAGRRSRGCTTSGSTCWSPRSPSASPCSPASPALSCPRFRRGVFRWWSRWLRTDAERAVAAVSEPHE